MQRCFRPMCNKHILNRMESGESNRDAQKKVRDQGEQASPERSPQHPNLPLWALRT